MKRTITHIAKSHTRSALLALLLLLISTSASAGVKEQISARNVDFYVTDQYLVVTADIILDSLKIGTNKQVLITPILESGSTESDDAQRTTDNSERKILPSVLVNGRNMHISYERGVLRNFPALRGHEIWKELRRENGNRQTVEYMAKVPVESWMSSPGTRLSLRYDPCGCGVASAPEFYNAPVQKVTVPEEKITNEIFSVPEINIPEVQIHAGRARIQFEVDRTALHVVPFTCRNGQYIDNRPELQVIDDSVKYALSDPNVVLTGIELCGYASPESPYLHNVELSEGRSKILAEYLADRYNLPRGSVTYTNVPENWGEFRDMVLESNEITERQRQQLLDLIDAPAYTPEDYDRKEQMLKTDPRYAKLYKDLILPVWFPKLRATSFVLKTQLKDMSDNQLKEVYKKTPEKMSLQELCRVARLYPADSDEFNDIVNTALSRYPHDQIAIVNAAIGAVASGRFDRARSLLKNAEQTPEVHNLEAIMAEAEKDYPEAARLYELAGEKDKADAMLEKARKLKEILESKD
ncbi:MAG: DUF3868 domain-containing protein [Muribaculaceae bacterium]|nr:DUF3868 domain-containing protein [Muribaculaceae bacterium]